MGKMESAQKEWEELIDWAVDQKEKRRKEIEKSGDQQAGWLDGKNLYADIDEEVDRRYKKLLKKYGIETKR